LSRPIRWYCARSSSARTSSRKEGPLSGPKERSDVEADHTYHRLDHSSLDTAPLPIVHLDPQWRDGERSRGLVQHLNGTTTRTALHCRPCLACSTRIGSDSAWPHRKRPSRCNSVYRRTDGYRSPSSASARACFSVRSRLCCRVGTPRVELDSDRSTDRAWRLALLTPAPAATCRGCISGRSRPCPA
jgi:hypothetical protein